MSKYFTFQDPATEFASALIGLHHYILFILLVILGFVTGMILRFLSRFGYKDRNIEYHSNQLFFFPLYIKKGSIFFNLFLKVKPYVFDFGVIGNVYKNRVYYRLSMGLNYPLYIKNKVIPYFLYLEKFDTFLKMSWLFSERFEREIYLHEEFDGYFIMSLYARGLFQNARVYSGLPVSLAFKMKSEYELLNSIFVNLNIFKKVFGDVEMVDMFVKQSYISGALAELVWYNNDLADFESSLDDGDVDLMFCIDTINYILWMKKKI